MSKQINFTEDQLATIEAVIVKYAEEHADDDMNDTTAKNAVRKEVAAALDCKTFQIIKPVDAVIARLWPEKDAKSSSTKQITRVVTEDPSASASEAEKPKKETKASSTKSKDTKAKAKKDKDDDDVRRMPPSKKGSSASDKKTVTTTSKSSKSASNGVTTPENKLTKNTTIEVVGMPYNADAEITVADFEDAVPAIKVFEQVIKLLTPKEAADVIARTKAYVKHLDKLYSKHELPSEVKGANGKTKENKKVQSFKFTRTGKDKTPSIKYVDPDELKLAVLNDEDAAPLIEYHLFIEKYAKNLPKLTSTSTTSSKSKSKAPEATVPWLELLGSDFVLSANILSTTVLKKLMPSGEAKLIKPLGIFVEDGAFEDIFFDGDKSDFDAIDYCLMFNDIRKVPTPKIGAVAKSIYMHRRGAIRQLSADDRKQLWFQALNNINSLTDEVIDEHQAAVDESYRTKFITPEDKQIIAVWQKLLSSRFVYGVVMNGIASQKFFEKPFLRLISHSTSIRLFMTALYPIAFLFTPFHCYFEDAINTKYLKESVAPVTFSKRIKEVIAKLLSAEAITFEAKAWCHYTCNKKADKNLTVRMLYPYVNSSSSTATTDEIEDVAPAKDDSLVTDDSDNNADGEDNE